MPDFSRRENRRFEDCAGQMVSVDVDYGNGEVVLGIDEAMTGSLSGLDLPQARQLIGALEWAADQVEEEQDG